MDILLNAIILAVVLGLLVNLIFKWLPPDKPTAVVAAGVLIIICALLSLNLILKQKENPSTPEPCPQPPPISDRSYEIAEHNKVDWQQLINNATFRVFATGIVLTSLEGTQMENLIYKVRTNTNFEVKLVMLQPDGEAVKLRAKDEGEAFNPAKIALKLTNFHKIINHSLSSDEKTRMTLKYVDVYPTISVTIIDKDLYAYFYPYGSAGKKSPVIIFRDFESKGGNIATFFKMHFKSIEEKAKQLTDEDYVRYEKMVSSISH